jgi:hypothetical protein
MTFRSYLTPLLLAGTALVSVSHADERRFTYTYEPETLPQGAMEVESWVTLRTGRSEEVGQEKFNRWDLRQELEIGVTDRYTLSFYLNESAQNYVDPATDEGVSEFEWKGISIENIYNLINPANNPVGVSAYLEGTYSGEEAELEQKIIFGQRHGDWKWALNLIHETEWEDNLEEVEGAFGGSAGLAYDFAKNWSIGFETRGEAIMPEYENIDSWAIYVGPVLSYRQEKWWAALTVMPQVVGWNDSETDGSDNLDLDHNEKMNIRLLFGFNF